MLLSMSSKLSVNDPAPDFRLPDAAGKEISLADFAGERVIVYFYPSAMTPGCTIQAVDFSDSLDQLSDAGYQVVGISPDSVEKLAKFTQQDDLTVRLLANPDLDVIKAYGAYGTRNVYGKEVVGVLRSTFVVDVDADGKGTIVLAQYSVRAKGHVDKLKRDLGVKEA